MRRAFKVALAVLIGSGALLLVLGLIIWTGNGDQLIAVHVALGIALVLSLWTISAIAARSGVPTRTVALAAGWGAVVVVLGLAQEELLPGDWHWTVQVLHLAVSMGAIWWGRRLATLLRQRQSERASSAASRPPIASTASR